MGYKFTVKQSPCLEIEFETETIAEGLAIIKDNETALGSLASELVTEGVNAEGAPPAKRGRGPNKPKPEATAPAPIPVPGAAAPPPPPLQSAPGIVPPAFVAPAPAAVPPATAPPPPAPPPPMLPAAPADAPAVPDFLKRTPPACTLAPKVVEAVKARVAGSADGGAAMVEWLATTGIVIKGCHYDEALAVLQFTDDVKMAPIATALGVA